MSESESKQEVLHTKATQEKCPLDAVQEAPQISPNGKNIIGTKKWSDLTQEEQFERIARTVATSTALETCENPHEIYRQIMARLHQ